MKRTTVMLPQDLKTRALRAAKSRDMSLGELIRRCLTHELGEAARTGALDDPLFADTAVYRGKAPEDLAVNHDAYLYGESH